MRVIVSGSTGFVGSALVPFLSARGHEVARLVRSEPGEGKVFWDPEVGEVDRKGLEGFDAVIHLAGESVVSGRWTPAKKTRIRASRVKGTGLLAEALCGLARPPKVLISASAIGYYGNRGDELLNEESASGTGFLADVGRAWEAATEPARSKGIRVVTSRLGLVLGRSGGALAKMLPPFRLGLGGPLGNGRQYMSWISMEDVTGAIHHMLVTDSLVGPVNLVGPHPVTNGEFTKTLGRVLSRPVLFPAPSFALRLALGEMASELLLSSTRVAPLRLQESRYSFRHPDLEPALRDILNHRS